MLCAMPLRCRRLRIVALASTLALLAGCEDSNRGNADQVARIVRADVHASGGSCAEKGTAVVSGQTVTLYACTMRDVPPQYRQFGSFDNSPQHYCYAVEGDYGVDGSSQFGPTCAENR
jgi:hypothetical protein